MKHTADSWDEVWRKIDVVAPHETVLRSVQRARIRSVLEVGAGSGRDLEELHVLGYEATFLDFSATAVKSFARRRPSVPAVRADARHLPFSDGSFDLVMSLGLLEHFSPQDRRVLLAEQFRVSRRFVLVDVPQKYALANVLRHLLTLLGRWPYGEELAFSYGDLRREIAAVAPKAHIVAGYGRELVPLPRNLKNAVYRRLPSCFRKAYVSTHRFLVLAVAGSFGLLAAKGSNCQESA